MSSNHLPETAPRKVCLVVSTLAQPGGAERVVGILANEWTRAGVAVTIVTTDSLERRPFFELDTDIDVQNLDVAGQSRNFIRAVARNIRQIVRIRRAVRRIKPDVVISFIDVLNASVVFACIGTGVPVIAAERTSPAHAPIGRMWTLLRNVAYRIADRVVVQTAGASDYLERSLRARLAIIPNPVPSREEPDHERIELSRVIAIGRFTAEKGFDVLIRAFAVVAHGFPRWTLTIYGDGPLRPMLESLIAEEQLRGRVLLPGLTGNSSDALAGADIFVLSSHFEGFPNALCEAMAAGLACVATDCPDGPREIIRQDVDGILVPPADRDALAAALRRLMSSPADRRRLGAEAREAMRRFSIGNVMAKWNALISDLGQKTTER